MGRLIRAIERRDSIGNPTKWLTLAFGGGTDTASGLRVNEIVAMRNLTIAACVNVIAQTVGQLPLPVYRRTPDGGKERAPDHQNYRILNRQPNERMTPITLREVITAHILTWGNGYLFLDWTNGGMLRAMYPLLPDRTRPMLNANGDLIYQTRIKTDPNSVSPNDQRQIDLPPEYVLHIPGLGFDGLKGYSVIAQFREAIGLGLAMEEFASRFFGNGAVPGFVLQSDKNIGIEQKRVLEAMWQENHQGLTNAHRLAILENGLKVERIGIPPEDAQFLESRKFSRNELASIYRVPPHMIGDVERSTSWGTGIEQQAIGFVVYTMLPMLTRWEQAVNIRLFSPAEQDMYFSEFLVDGLLRGDLASRGAYYNLGFGKWLTADDIRRKENEPIWGTEGFGEQKFTPSGMIPLGGAGAEDSPLAVPGPDEAQPSAASAPPFDVRVARVRLAAAHRVAFADIADRVLRRERADITRTHEKGSFNAESFYREHRDYVARQFLPALQTYAESVALIVGAEIGGSPAISPRFVRSYAESLAERHCAESSALLGEGDALSLERAFGTSIRRAERIADRESIRAGNAFAKALYRDADVKELRWVLGDDRAECREMAARPLRIDATFRHPPLADDCDCVLVARDTRNDPVLALAERLVA